MYSLLPDNYRAVVNKTQSTIFSVDMLGGITGKLEQYDADMGKDSMIIIEPPSINSRIVNQYSFFSIIPSGMEDVATIILEYSRMLTLYGTTWY